MTIGPGKAMRWRPRWSVRALLLLLTFVGLLLAIYVNKLRRHRQAIAAARSWHGAHWYDYQVNPGTRSIDAHAVPPDQGLLSQLLGEESLFGLLIVSDGTVTDEDLRHLKEFPTLLGLAVNCPRITDAGLKHVAGLKQLREFWLVNNTNVTNDCLANLRNLDGLERVSLRNLPQITDEAVVSLQRALPKCTIDYSKARGRPERVSANAPQFR